jgi:hypothetical protein
MIEPVIEKWPHPQGIEYAWVWGEKILGSVIPVEVPDNDKKPKKWKAIANQRVVGVFTGVDGRLVAMRAVQHFTKHIWSNHSPGAK